MAGTSSGLADSVKDRLSILNTLFGQQMLHIICEANNKLVKKPKTLLSNTKHKTSIDVVIFLLGFLFI